LLYSTNRVFEPPKGKSSDFSSQNWANVEEPQPKCDTGASKLVNRLIRKVLIYSSQLTMLKDTYWAAIIDGAKAMLPKKGKVTSAKVMEKGILSYPDLVIQTRYDNP
jgi:hypothetical protein